MSFMRPYRCKCFNCQREHVMQLEPEEYRMLMSYPLSLTPEGFLNIDCDDCTPFVYSKPPAPKGGGAP
jgi:hypothetical protein